MKHDRLIIYSFAVVTFLIIDALWLSIMTSLFYRPALGELISDSPRLMAAGVFYIVYAIGAAELIIIRYGRSIPPAKGVFFRGALLGMLAYGTYEMTNYATIATWPLSVVVVDVVWGALVTGGALWLSLGLYRKVRSI